MIENIPIRIAVTGVTGRMGKSIIQCIIQQQKQQHNNSTIVLGAAITRSQSNVCGVDVGTFTKSNDIGVIITDNIELVKEDFDILIDFTSPESSVEYLKFCTNNYKNIIIGTTGFSKAHHLLIQDASQNIGIVYSANFSIGITLMLKLLKKIAHTIGHSVDIDIIESHHNKKNDIPSGTALMMKNIIQKNKLSINAFNNIQYNHNNSVKKLFNPLLGVPFSDFNNDIEIHSIRAGDIVGEHTALFSGTGECLKITHTAFNRTIFAYGALHAAIWLGRYNKKIGLFDLNNVLEI